MKPIENLYKYNPELFKRNWGFNTVKSIPIVIKNDYIKLGKVKIISSDKAPLFFRDEVFVYHTKQSLKKCGNQKVFEGAKVFEAKTHKEFIIEFMKLLTFKGYYEGEKFITLQNG